MIAMIEATRSIDLWKTTRLAIVAGSLGLILAHGCHGRDEDHELLMPRLAIVADDLSPAYGLLPGPGADH